MMPELSEFASDLFQEILSQSDVDGIFSEDVFFDYFSDCLVAAGEIDAADRAPYQGAVGKGIRVDGYGGDPLDTDGGVLSLIICDFHQSQSVGRLVRSEMNAIFKRLLNFLRKSLDSTWRASLEESSPAFGLADLISARWKGISKVRLFLISNRELSERVDGRPADELDSRMITYSVWDISRIHKFSMQSQEREDIDVDLENGFGGVLPVLPARTLTTGHESYLAVIPGDVLARIYDRWGARLLEQNVRVFLQARGSVNKGIKQTIESDPSMFFAYNNGITATAESIIIGEHDQFIVLKKLVNFQIVNGGQTTASIHRAFIGNEDLSEVFVQMKLSVVEPATAKLVVPKISRYANTQNRVSAADFFANHQFHVRVEQFSRRIFAPSADGAFRQSKWFYERARGQYSDAYALLTPAQRKKFALENPRSQLFSKTDLGKYLNVWVGKPDKVSLGAQKNFAIFAQDISRRWEKNAQDFNESWYREAIAKAIVFKQTERLVSRQPWYSGGYRANIVAYSISKLAHDVEANKMSVDYGLIWQNQALSRAMQLSLERVTKYVYDVLIDPPSGISNVTEWAKKQACWARVRAIELVWPKDFLDELISVDDQVVEARRGRSDQRMLDGVEAQISVTNAGSAFWSEVLAWGRERKLLTHAEMGVLSLASRIPAKLPSAAQSVRIVQTLRRLQENGFNGTISVDA